MSTSGQAADHDNIHSFAVETAELAGHAGLLTAEILHQFDHAIEHMDELILPVTKNMKLSPCLSSQSTYATTSQTMDVVQHTDGSYKLPVVHVHPPTIDTTWSNILNNSLPSALEAEIIGAGAIIRICHRIYQAWNNPWYRSNPAQFVKYAAEIIVKNITISLTALVTDTVVKAILSIVVKLLGTIGGMIASCVLGVIGGGYLGYQIAELLINLFYFVFGIHKPKHSKWHRRIVWGGCILGIVGGLSLTIFCPPAGIVLFAGACTVAITKYLVHKWDA